MDNKTTLLILMIVLIAFITLLTILGLVFIIGLRKRAPVVKIVMAPQPEGSEQEEEEETSDDAAAQESEPPQEGGEEGSAPKEPPQTEQIVLQEEDGAEPEEDEDSQSFILEGQERVRYDRSLYAKIAQLKKESKEWYGELKNELLSYEKMKSRMSWRRETFRIGRMNIARFTVRGKTLCLMLAVEPDGYAGTKYAVEDVSGTVSLADTPTLYRIKSARRLKYAKEMIAGIMRELKVYKNSRYEAQDYFMPYEGDVAFMQRGLVKRVVGSHTRMFKIEEVDAAAEAAATKTDEPNAESADKE